MNKAHQAKIGTEVSLGKLERVEDPNNLMLAKYLDTETLGPPPVSVVRTPQVEAVIGQDWGMMLNDSEGDCTIAALGHAEQVWQAIRHAKSVRPTDDQIGKLYIPDTGTDDSGRSEYEVLKYVRKHGMFHHKLYAFAEIGLSNHDLIKHAIDLFGLAYIGVALPISAQQQSYWDVVVEGSDPGSWGGHAIILVDYDAQGPTCVTWGKTLKMSWAFFTKYCDEAYALLESEWFSKGKTIDGFDRAALRADLEAITS